MELSGQDTEIRLLAEILPRLTRRAVVAVGVERGGFVREMLDAGAEHVHTFDPEPANVAFLRERFRGEPRLTVHGLAIGTQEGDVNLHVSTGTEDTPFSLADTLRPDSSEIAHHPVACVKARSLGSLVASGQIPRHVGILKMETDGHDLSIIAGLGELDCDVIVVQQGRGPELLLSLGLVASNIGEMLDALVLRGFGHFAFFVHHGEFTLLQWDDATGHDGRAGDLVFVHDRVIADVLPAMLESATTLARNVIAQRAPQVVGTGDLSTHRDIRARTAEERLATLESFARSPVIHGVPAFGMRSVQDVDTATLIHDQRVQLDQLHSELAERATPLSTWEAGLLVTSMNLRLLLIEERLRPIKRSRSRSRIIPRRLRRGLARIRGLWRPRIGTLRHYFPRPLEVPASYLRARAPDPAPRISVVTPCFQHGQFIERTLRSILDQGYPELEYFVQDGGSTDETLEILECYNEEVGWISERDCGQADAINRAFARTSGEIMAWLNSDDLLLPGSLAYIATYFASHPDIDVVYGNRLMIDGNDRQIGAWILPPHDDLALTLADYVPQETLFFRRHIWEAAGGRLDSTFGYALDWDLLLRFRAAGANMVRLPRFIGAFRIHEEQKTSASYALGLAEMARLRERVHGRQVTLVEVNERLRRYFRRHVVYHNRQRICDRLSLSRVLVNTPSPRGRVPIGETGEVASAEPTRSYSGYEPRR